MAARIGSSEVDRVRAAIVPIDTAETRAAYREGRFPRAETCKDRDRRYRWDLYWASGARFTDDGGLLDAHIDTALRSIVGPL